MQKLQIGDTVTAMIEGKVTGINVNMFTGAVEYQIKSEGVFAVLTAGKVLSVTPEGVRDANN